MKVSQNIGIVNALIRITVGFTILAWSTSKLVKRPWRDSYLWMALIGGMKVGEGILRFCPITAMFEKDQESGPEEGKSMLNIGSLMKKYTGSNENDNNKTEDIDSDEKKQNNAPDLPYDPS
jgi:hypothetical protein